MIKITYEDNQVVFHVEHYKGQALAVAKWFNQQTLGM